MNLGRLVALENVNKILPYIQKWLVPCFETGWIVIVLLLPLKIS